MHSKENDDILQDVSFDTCSSQTLQQKIKCLICEKMLSSKGALKQHIESIHKEKQSYKCSICKSSCSKIGDFEKHIETVHEGKKPLKCSLSNKSCSQKKNLKMINIQNWA